MMAQEQAEVLGLQVLGWLAAQDDLLGVFLGASGMSQSDIQGRAADPEFLGAVLDFVLMDDAWVTGVGEALEMPPERVMEARAALPGGEQVHWT